MKAARKRNELILIIKTKRLGVWLSDGVFLAGPKFESQHQNNKMFLKDPSPFSKNCNDLGQVTGLSTG